MLCSDKDGRARARPGGARAASAFDDIERRYGELARIRRKGALVVHRDEAGLAAEPARLERLRAAGRALRAARARAGARARARPRPGPARRLAVPRRPAVRPARDRPRAGPRRARPARGPHRRPRRADPARRGRADRHGRGARRRGRARRGRLERGARPRRRASSCRSSRARASSSASPAVAFTRPPQGPRRQLPRRRLRARGGAAGLHRARDDVARQRARRLEPRAPRLRHHGRSRGDRDAAGARRARHAGCGGARGGRGVGGAAAVAPGRAAGHRASRRPALWVATGHEGAGIGLGPISGELVAAAICGETAGA